MLTYKCLVNGSISEAARERVIQGLQQINGQQFGITPDQLTVQFTKVEKGMWFTAGKPSQASMVLGSVPAGTSQAQRVDLMSQVCAMFSEVTGAPRAFVHVQFHHRPAPTGGTPFDLHAGIRAGRDQTLKALLIKRCIEVVAQIADMSAEHISMRTSATQASWILEGGRVLPEPGEEDAWLRSH